MKLLKKGLENFSFQRKIILTIILLVVLSSLVIAEETAVDTTVDTCGFWCKIGNWFSEGGQEAVVGEATGGASDVADGVENIVIFIPIIDEEGNDKLIGFEANERFTFDKSFSLSSTGTYAVTADGVLLSHEDEYSVGGNVISQSGEAVKSLKNLVSVFQFNILQQGSIKWKTSPTLLSEHLQFGDGALIPEQSESKIVLRFKVRNNDLNVFDGEAFSISYKGLIHQYQTNDGVIKQENNIISIEDLNDLISKLNLNNDNIIINTLVSTSSGNKVTVSTGPAYRQPSQALKTLTNQGYNYFIPLGTEIFRKGTNLEDGFYLKLVESIGDSEKNYFYDISKSTNRWTGKNIPINTYSNNLILKNRDTLSSPVTVELIGNVPQSFIAEGKLFQRILTETKVDICLSITDEFFIDYSTNEFWDCNGEICWLESNEDICVDSVAPVGTYTSLDQIRLLAEEDSRAVGPTRIAAATGTTLPQSINPSLQQTSEQKGTCQTQKCKEIDEVWAQKITNNIKFSNTNKIYSPEKGEWLFFTSVYPTLLPGGGISGVGGSSGGIKGVAQNGLIPFEGPNLVNYAGTLGILRPEVVAVLQGIAPQFSAGIRITSAYRTPEEQLKVYQKNCPNGQCSVLTCNPFNSESGQFYPLTDMPCAHVGGYAFDAWCATENIVSKSWVHDPICQAELNKFLTSQGFCRISSEPWHFEFAQFSKDRTCLQNKADASYTRDGMNYNPTLNNGQSCPAWNFQINQCDSQAGSFEDISDPAILADLQKGLYNQDFLIKVETIANDLNINPIHLLVEMRFETNAEFKTGKYEGSGAVGLIQFTTAGANAVGSTKEQLATLNQLQQLDYVQKYFQPYKDKMNNFGDVAMAIFAPKAIGGNDNFVLYSSNESPQSYAANKGVDTNNDNKITRGEYISFALKNNPYDLSKTSFFNNQAVS